ncbi:FAD-dependent oxidoreductase (plasmid) [Streptomyces scopuliridis]|uniref:FAD-dependent oxidoreductase n=1 Tax=Streptomyces scopuliridis TaxID=452529 RepID=UPI002DDC60CC|nr:FAD-dependent oxidoreductase [Streptomyces scopuliridis]WSB39093.1 FAD-dependent oxidoreductase [Streptomyces scopuliridis]
MPAWRIVDTFDLVIIGTGPAGLAAAQRLAGSPYNVALVDGGKLVGERDRHAAVDMTRGHGGAGLFSDGKFSFFPSASELWTLPRSADLRAAYDWTCELLGSYGLDSPPFPSDPTAFTVGSGEWVLKEYPSDYLSLEARLRLTADMVAATNATVLTETEVVKAEFEPATDVFRLTLGDSKGQESEVLARRLVLASGRFGPLGLRALTDERSFRRLEVGFRIEQSADQAFFKDMKQLDPKLRLREQDGSVEWRTFCACRDGEAALTETQGLWTVSGRSDCPPTGRSNVGFNTRILDEAVAARAMAPALAAMAKEESYFNLTLDALMDSEPETVATFDSVYGAELREIMVRGLSRLAAAYPAIRDNGTQLIGPTLEGVGWYPRVDGDLRLLDTPAWVAGDACGLFRGIVAAMISGHYAADSALLELEALR